MTDRAMADKIYIEPMTVEAVKEIIKKERPDSLIPNLGGQTGLNLAMELCEDGFLDEMGVKLLGANPTTIAKAEDRQMFKDTMEKIGEPCIASKVVHTVEDAVAFTEEIGLPVIIRPAYTLGGTGGGIAYTWDELREISASGIMHHLQHGERGPGRRAHRRLGRCCTDPDPFHRRSADATHLCPQDHRRAGHRGRLQRTVCPASHLV